MPVQRADDLGDVLGVDLVLEELAAGLRLVVARLGSASCVSSSGISP